MIFIHFFFVLNITLVFFRNHSNMNILEFYEFLKDSNKKEPKTLFLILLNKHIFDGE